MRSTRHGIEIALVAILAIILGVAGVVLLPNATVPASATLGALPGRGLEPPWWTAVKHQKVGTVETYTVPADVLFGFNSSDVDALGQSTLRALAPELRGAISVLVAGCTDSTGGVDSPYNVALSKSRAEAAVAVLEANGVPKSIVQIQGWADTHPVSAAAGLDASTVAALDRRVVIEVTK